VKAGKRVVSVVVENPSGGEPVMFVGFSKAMALGSTRRERVLGQPKGKERFIIPVTAAPVSTGRCFFFFFFLIHMFVFRQSDYLLHRSEGLVPYASA